MWGYTVYLRSVPSYSVTYGSLGGIVVTLFFFYISALLFIFAMLIHMMRILFTGAFRKPREANWVIGVLLLVLGMAEGFLGYSLPDDLLSGTGLRAVSAFILSIPVIGTWTHWAVFGGDYPGEIIIPRFYSLHILLLRVHRIPRPVTVRVREEYHGCHSWVEIDRELPFEGTPVMADEEFDRARQEIHSLCAEGEPVLV